MYLTVINILTGKSVPFFYRKNSGEIMINSIYPEDNEDTCIVHVGDVFYEYSWDWRGKWLK